MQSYRQTVWADRVDLISSHNTEADNGDHSYRLVTYTPHSVIVTDPPGWERTSWLT